MMGRFFITLTGASTIIFMATSALAAPEGRHTQRLDRMIERIDADQSGQISFAEFAARSNERFETADADGDGVLTAEERESARANRLQREGGRAEHRGMDPGKMAARAAHRLEQIDTDKDGNISRAEHDAHQQERFTEIDQNGDGALTRDEFVANHKARREMRGHKRG